jgi:chorismate mutase
MWQKTIVIVALVCAVIPISRAQDQPSSEKLLPLIDASARRLAIADQVALSKWDSEAPVEDSAREAQVISAATKLGEAKGLSPSDVSRFFQAQIEANKIVQYALLSDWRRNGHAPEHAPVDLAKVVRPQLDQLQATFIEQLAQTASVRSQPTCSVDLAHAIGTFLADHKQAADSLHSIALERSLAATCAH